MDIAPRLAITPWPHLKLSSFTWNGSFGIFLEPNLLGCRLAVTQLSSSSSEVDDVGRNYIMVN